MKAIDFSEPILTVIATIFYYKLSEFYGILQRSSGEYHYNNGVLFNSGSNSQSNAYLYRVSQSHQFLDNGYVSILQLLYC